MTGLSLILTSTSTLALILVSFLSVVELALDEIEIPCCKIIGSMTLKARSAAIADLGTGRRARVLLGSVKACGEGLNLTQANHVFIMDPWWNTAGRLRAGVLAGLWDASTEQTTTTRPPDHHPAHLPVEEQAAARVHRIGQTRPVHVTKFIVAGGIEERILQIQERKSALAKGSMENLSEAEMRKVRLDNMKSCFLELEP